MTTALRLGLAAVGVGILAVTASLLAGATEGSAAWVRLPLTVVPLVVALGSAGLVIATVTLTRAIRLTSSDPGGAGPEADAAVRRSVRDVALCGATVLAGPLVLVLVSAVVPT